MGVIKVVTWNVDGLHAMLLRRKEPLQNVLKGLNADIVCIQETKLRNSDLQNISSLTIAPGWKSYLGLCHLRSNYAGVATFCRNSSVTTIAAEEGLSGFHDNIQSDKIHTPPPEVWSRFSKAELEHNDKEGRCIITDHGAFVLIHLYGPAVTDITAERFPRKLTFYEAVRIRVDHMTKQGRNVLIVGDLNIAHRPIDHCDWAAAKLPAAETQRAFLENRPDRRLFTSFLDPRREGAPMDVLRHFHPDRPQAYTVWGRAGGTREHNHGSRVDYILAAVPQATTSKVLLTLIAYFETRMRASVTNSSFLHSLQACDIAHEWQGSDHAPVWLQLDVDLTPSRQSFSQSSKQIEMESAYRFQGKQGGQPKITNWLGPKGVKRRRMEAGDTPPRIS